LEAAIAAGQRVQLFYYLHSAKNYWAKDIIFLVTSHDEVGMQAWIDSYMGLHSPSKREIASLPPFLLSLCLTEVFVITVC